MLSNENIPKYRTINQCYELIKELDKDTAISCWMIRSLKDCPQIKSIKRGNKVLMDINSLLQYLFNGDKAYEE